MGYGVSFNQSTLCENLLHTTVYTVRFPWEGQRQGRRGLPSQRSHHLERAHRHSQCKQNKVNVKKKKDVACHKRPEGVLISDYERWEVQGNLHRRGGI